MVKINNIFGDRYRGKQGQAVFQGFYGKQIRRVVSGKRKNTAPGQREQQRRFRIGLSWYKGLSTVEKEGLKQFLNMNGINLTAQQYAIKTALDRGWATKEVFTENAVTEHYRADWDAEGWPYRQVITITNNTTSDLTDYQVRLELTADNVGANFDWSSGGADLRFYDESGAKLPYWVESWDSVNKTATVWVKVGLIPGSASTTVKMYYGNTAAQSESDGTAVFEFFDGFEGTDLDPTKWDTNGFAGYDGIAGYYEVANGRLRIWGDGTNWRILRAIFNIGVSDRLAILTKVMRESTASYSYNALTDSAGTNKQRVCALDYSTDGDWDYGREVDGTFSFIYDLGTFSANTWYYLEIARTGDTSFITRVRNADWSELWSVSDRQASWNVAFTPVFWKRNNVNEYYEFFLIRKYAPSEPSAALGSEEYGLEQALTTVKVEHVIIEHAGMKHVYILDDQGQVVKEYDNLSNLAEGQVCTRLDFRNNGSAVRQVIIESVSGVLNSITF